MARKKLLAVLLEQSIYPLYALLHTHIGHIALADREVCRSESHLQVQVEEKNMT